MRGLVVNGRRPRPPAGHGVRADIIAARSLNVVVIRLHGSVELAPLTGLADCVLDITATGRTLAANNLVEIANEKGGVDNITVVVARITNRPTGESAANA